MKMKTPHATYSAGHRAAFRAVLGLCLIVGLPLFLGACTKKTPDLDKRPVLTCRCPETTREQLFGGHSVLVIVPHQDDETSLAAGIMEQYVRCGSTVRVLFVTNGDYFGLGETRLREALDALAVCGVPKDNVIFLGYGDQWQQTHIYHAPDNASIRSAAGREQTYALPDHAPYRENTYTRAHLVENIAQAILEFRPDTIFCIDLDLHSDHRATSLLFEEAIHEILTSTPSYTPDVYKGFAYSTAWLAPNDFYADNLLSMQDPTENGVIAEQPAYTWDERVRFPVSVDAQARLKEPTLVYRMLACHASQDAAKRAESVANGDHVFWYRPTGSLLYRAAVSASSGNAVCLTDFKLTDIENVVDYTARFARCLWTPDASDERKEITVRLHAPATLTALRLYGDPTGASRIQNAQIRFSDGSTLETGILRDYGAPTTIRFAPKQNITGFTLSVTAFSGDTPALSELEAFSAEPDKPLNLIKLMNTNDDFCYDYWIDASGQETLRLYGAAGELNGRYTLSTEGTGGTAVFDSDGILVTCRKGASFLLTVRSAEDPSLSDTVRISNPRGFTRWRVEQSQKAEQKRLPIAGKRLLPEWLVPAARWIRHLFSNNPA